MTHSLSRSIAVATGRMLHEKRRSEIINAAGALFAKSGYHDTTMDEVSRYLSISKPVLYNYFEGKLDLYLTVLDEHLNRLVASVRNALLSTPDDDSKRVRAAIQAYFDFVDSNDGVSKLVFESNVLTSEPAVQDHLDRAMDSCIDAVCQLVSMNAEVDAHEARILAVSLVGASQQAATYWCESLRPMPKNRAIDAVTALCWGGLSSVPRSLQPLRPNPTDHLAAATIGVAAAPTTSG